MLDGSRCCNDANEAGNNKRRRYGGHAEQKMKLFTSIGLIMSVFDEVVAF